jgi:hypothetical protein
VKNELGLQRRVSFKFLQLKALHSCKMKCYCSLKCIRQTASKFNPKNGGKNGGRIYDFCGNGNGPDCQYFRWITSAPLEGASDVAVNQPTIGESFS